MKHKKVYEQPILKVIHIENSTFLTAGSSHNSGTLPSGMNNNRNIEFGTQIGEGNASGHTPNHLSGKKSKINKYR